MLFPNISHQDFPSVSIFEYKKLKGGITLPGFGIIVYNRNDKALIQHEYGHFLDYLNFRKKYGFFLSFLIFYFFIGVPSLLISIYSFLVKRNKRTDFYTEKRADNLAKRFFAEKYLTDKRFSTFLNT
jgi:hypothetical protein